MMDAPKDTDIDSSLLDKKVTLSSKEYQNQISNFSPLLVMFLFVMPNNLCTLSFSQL